MSPASGAPGSCRAFLAAVSDRSEPVAWGEQQSVVLVSPDEWLVVESGHVDLFVVEVYAGRPRGPWTALCRLDKGDVVTGPLPGPRHRVLARRVGDAQARTVPLARVRSIVRGAAQDGTDEALVWSFCAAVESTLRKIGWGPGLGLPPREFVALSAGETVTIDAGESSRTVEELAWVTVESGEVRVGERQRHTCHAGDVLCLTRMDWLTAVRPSRLHARTTRATIDDDSVWSRVVGHLTLVLFSVDRRAERLRSDHLDRVARASDRDEAVLDDVRSGLDRFLRQQHLGTAAENELPARGHLAAVLTVLDHLGVPYADPPPHLHGSLGGDYDALGRSGWVRTREIRVDERGWGDGMGPLVGIWGVDRVPVAFLPSAGGYLVVGRGLDEPVRLTRANQFEAGRTAWIVYPTLPAGVGSLRGLFRFGLIGQRRTLSLFAVTALLVGLASVLTPVLNGRILGDFVAAANRSMIVQGSLVVMVSALVSGAFSVVQNLVVLRLQGSVTSATQTAVWIRLMQLPLRFFERYETGRLGTIVLGLKAAQEVFSGLVVTSALGLVVAVANLVLIFWVDGPLALLGLLLVLVGWVTGLVTLRLVVAIERERYRQDQRLSAMTYEMLAAVAKIRAAAAEERTLNRWSIQQRAVQSRSMASRRLQDRLGVFNTVYPFVCLGVIYVAASARGSAALPLASLLTFLTAFNLMLAAILSFTGSVLTAAPVVPMVEGLRPILQEDPEAGADRPHVGDLSGRISLRQVVFRYGEDGPLVLDGVDLDVNPGEFVAIVGPSGSGKSTIVRLLLGFANPLAGSVLFDGQDLAELDVSSVRRQCGVVLQNGALLAGDIRDNIAAGGRFRDDDLWDAAEMAGLAEDIRAMPMGLSTVVDETARGLSGGQVQRLMVARALVNRPRVVILDEATSALDNPTQQLITQATRRLNATRIVVAHRLSTVRDADRIIVLDRGRVVEQGRFDDLIATPDGVFAALARGQLS
jgi:NHLM bacteriocin system ABC transporter ATP-binding protein